MDPQVNETTPSRPAPEYLLVPTRDAVQLVDVDDIVYLESRDKYTDVHTDSCTYLLDTTLVDLERRLPPRQFLRIHRRHIVNVRFIKQFQKWGHRRFRLVMRVPTESELVVSRRSVGEVMSKLAHTGAAR